MNHISWGYRQNHIGLMRQDYVKYRSRGGNKETAPLVGSTEAAQQVEVGNTIMR